VTIVVTPSCYFPKLRNEGAPMMKMSTNNAVPTNNEIQKQQAIQALHFAQITNDYQQFVKKHRM
jgi:hypothetical protein